MARRGIAGPRWRWLAAGLAVVAALAFACSRQRPQPASAPVATPTPGPPAPADPPTAEVAEPLPRAPEPSVPALETAPAPTRRPEPPRPIIIRVGLASDQETLTFPCCLGQPALEIGGRFRPLTGPLTVRPAPGRVERISFRLQAAALKSEEQARTLAHRLAAQTGQPADAHFDASIDLYRVWWGRFPSRESALAGKRRHRIPALESAWVVKEGGRISEPALAVAGGGLATSVPGRWLRLRPTGESGWMRAPEGGYRGDLLVFLNDRGSLNLINEVDLEDYLRGVVPEELGPALYPRIEALKAQAVAARTYTLRNLGEFTDEGYDICATPRCQVYGGQAVEHPLSDRAVAETAGQVLVWEGQPIDALFSAACGGHTEDVAVVFPDKDHPYLRAVPSLEGGEKILDTGTPAGRPFPAALARRLLPPPAGDPVARLNARLEHLQKLVGAPPPAPLEDLRLREVTRYVQAVLATPIRGPQPASSGVLPPAELPAGLAEILGALGPEGLDGAKTEALLLGLAEELGAIEWRSARFLGLEGPPGARRLRLASGDRVQEVALPRGLLTVSRRGSAQLSGRLELGPGDPLRLAWQGKRLVALVHEVDPAAVRRDSKAEMRTWSRFRSRARLAGLVEERYPGLGFRDFEILSRGVSGRVAEMRVFGDGNRSVRVRGLDVRWLLDVPETLFEARPTRSRNGQQGWLFEGRGHGHGVGMCQVGAYGMAGRGLDYRTILDHYYSGAQLARARPARSAS